MPVALQGNMSQSQRDNAMAGFREGRFDILVATDIASRGIDVAGVSHVINFDVPTTPEAYTHRIGRTGRAERSGKAYTFVSREDAGAVRAIERSLGSTITQVRAPGFETEAGPSEERRRPSSRGRRPGGGNARGPGNGERHRRPRGTRGSKGPNSGANSGGRGGAGRGRSRRSS